MVATAHPCTTSPRTRTTFFCFEIAAARALARALDDVGFGGSPFTLTRNDAIGLLGASHGGFGAAAAAAAAVRENDSSLYSAAAATKRARTMVDASPGSSLTQDPSVAFACPCCACEYDCQKRAPVRSACACKHLLCRKCAGVVSSLPNPAPCGLCGTGAVGPFEATDFQKDPGVLLALMGRLQQQEPYVVQRP
jgi:hypothetical protein